MAEEGGDKKDQMIAELLERVETAEAKSVQSNNMAMNSTGMGTPDNLVQYQLDVTEMLEKLKNYYKGTTQEGYDEDGNIVWLEQTDESLIPLNEYGVSCMMEVVTKYIDKNTSLSNYPEQRIMEILADLGDEMVLFILCNYEKMGMDTHQKKTKFRILIATTLHVIESAYRKAIFGQTSKTLNETRLVTQSDMIGNRAMPQQQTRRPVSLKDPKSWF